MKRLFDIIVILIALAILWPLLLIGALGVKLGSSGPIFYLAKRAGRQGIPFDLYKFRSMHVGSDHGSKITVPNDSRVFPFGSFIRKVKIDELPQLVNILKGDMSIVGPRPEDASIVERHYTDWMRETLEVRPGLTSPGAVFGYLHGDAYLDPEHPETSYIQSQMPLKLAIERYYLERAGFWSDIRVMFATAFAILKMICGNDTRIDQETLIAAERWCGPIEPVKKNTDAGHESCP